MMQRKLYAREGLKVYPTELTKLELESQYSTLFGHLYMPTFVLD
jgi:hypothetical protein